MTHGCDSRALVDLGCLCMVDKAKARELAASGGDIDTFDLSWLQFKTLAHYHYLPEGRFNPFICWLFIVY